jgi:hypothetical protein
VIEKNGNQYPPDPSVPVEKGMDQLKLRLDYSQVDMAGSTFSGDGGTNEACSIEVPEAPM